MTAECKGPGISVANVIKLVQGDTKPSLAHDWDEVNFVWVLNEARKLEIAAVGVRAKRDALLAQSDWTQLPDVHIADKEAWAVYRQALRDITEQPGFPTDVVWPEAQF